MHVQLEDGISNFRSWGYQASNLSNCGFIFIFLHHRLFSLKKYGKVLNVVKKKKNHAYALDF